MGFFSSLFGIDQSMGALNAVLANKIWESTNDQVHLRFATEIANLISTVRKSQSAEEILAGLSKECRVVQMNFLALVCDNLGIKPPVLGNVWTRIANPYQLESQVFSAHISAAIDAIAKQDHVRLSWPGNDKKIDFLLIYKRANHGQKVYEQLIHEFELVQHPFCKFPELFFG